MTLSDLFDKYNELCVGNYHPTEIYVGKDIWEALKNRGQFDGTFSGAIVWACGSMPDMAAHFENRERRHDPRYNAYVDFTPKKEQGGFEVL